MAKTVLITGTSGLLGRQILQVFQKDPTWKTIGLAFSRAGESLHKVDLTNSKDLRRAFEKFSVCTNVYMYFAYNGAFFFSYT